MSNNNLVLIKAGPSGLKKDAVGKKIFIFGAGNVIENCLELYFQDTKVEAIIDNNESKIGTKLDDIVIISVPEFIKRVVETGVDKCFLLISPVFYALDIYKQLNSYEQLKGLHTYLHIYVRDYFDEDGNVFFLEKKHQIEKKIHYCWFGKTQIPKRLQDCIDSWKKVCPEYRIVRWDESNYDITKNQYMKQAYENKKWGFVPDFARLDIIYSEGGIYLDTDVELLKPIDKLLCNSAFFGFGANDQINLGLGFGAKKRHEFIKELMSYYDDKAFINQDGSLNNKTCYFYQNPVFKKRGFEIRNTYQVRDDIVVYPSEVLSPKGCGFGNFWTDNTLSVHHGTYSWASHEEMLHLEELKMKMV